MTEEFNNLNLKAKDTVLEASFQIEYELFNTTSPTKKFFKEDVLNSVNINETKQISAIVYVPNHFFPVLVDLTKDKDNNYTCTIKVNQQELPFATDNQLREKIEEAIKGLRTQVHTITTKIIQDDGEALKYIPYNDNNCLLTTYFSLYFSEQKSFNPDEYDIIKHMARNGNSTEFRKYTLLELAIKYIKNDYSANITEAINTIYNAKNGKGEYDWFTDATELDNFFKKYKDKSKEEVIESLQAQKREMFEKAENDLQNHNNELNQRKELELAEKQKTEETLKGGGIPKQAETQQQNGQAPQEVEEPQAPSILDSEEVQDLISNYREVKHNKYNFKEREIFSFDDLLLNNLNNRTKSLNEEGNICTIEIDDTKYRLPKKGTKKLSKLLKSYIGASDYKTIVNPKHKLFKTLKAEGVIDAKGSYVGHRALLSSNCKRALRKAKKEFTGGYRIRLASDNTKVLNMYEAVAVMTVLIREKYKDDSAHIINYTDYFEFLNIKTTDKKLHADLKLIVAKELELNRLLLDPNAQSMTEVCINDINPLENKQIENYLEEANQKENTTSVQRKFTPNTKRTEISSSSSFVEKERNRRAIKHQSSTNAIEPPKNEDYLTI